MKRIRYTGITLILISALVSFFLSTSVDMSYYEMGGLYNYFFPAAIGLLTILLFLGSTFIFKKQIIVEILLALCCLYNLYIGVALHFEKENWPFVFF